MGKIYVGNIPFRSTEEDLRNHFSPVGEVRSVKIILDRETGRSKGFCFIEMDNVEKAIQELNDKDFQGRFLKVKEAVEKPWHGPIPNNSNPGSQPRNYPDSRPPQRPLGKGPKGYPMHRDYPIDNNRLRDGNQREEPRDNYGNQRESLPTFQDDTRRNVDFYKRKVKRRYDEQPRFRREEERFV